VTALTLLDTAGRTVALESLWRERPAMLVFVRHFGCLFCREQVAEVRSHAAAFVAAGVDVVVVGNGSVAEAAAFATEHAGSLRVLTDPTREAYCAFGMQRGWRTAANVGTVSRAVRALAKGYRQAARPQGDPFQQGGVLIFEAGGRERWRFISKEAGEHPPIEAVLAALPKVDAALRTA
jgi:peroxiredoxin